MNDVIDTGIKFMTLLIVVAIIGVLVSKRSSTASVVRSFASAFGSILGVVVSPITTGAAAASSVSSGAFNPTDALGNATDFTGKPFSPPQITQ